MTKILPFLVLLAACSPLRSHLPTMEYCGEVDLLSIYVKQGSLVTCAEAIKITAIAYELLWQKDGAPLNHPWRVEFTWGIIDIMDPWGKTTPAERLIQVQSSAPQTILHELMHAYMFEYEKGGKSHHRKMCASKTWRELEDSFGVIPYCHLLPYE